MNRQKISLAENCISYNQRFDEAQSFMLSGPLSAPGAAFDQTATTQRPLLLQSFGIQTDGATGTTVTDIKIAGQSLFTSTASAPAECFAFSNFGAESRVIGLTISNNQTVNIAGTVAGAGGSVGFAVSAYPIESTQVRNLKQQGSRFNYCFPIASGTAVPALAGGVAGTTTLTATATRGCVLGEVRMANQDSTVATGVADSDLFITSFKVSGIEMLSGASDQQVPFSALVGSASDVLGLNLGYPIEPNAIVEVVVKNNGANAATVGGVIFIAPYSKS